MTSSPEWTAADLIDLDYFLEMDSDAEPSALHARDEQIGRERLLPALGSTMGGDPSPELRRHGLRLWLEERRRADEHSPAFRGVWPGEAYAHALTFVGVLLSVILFCVGAGLISSVLHFDERYFNVPVFLVASLGPQWLLLLVLGLSWLLKGRRATGAAGFLQGLAENWIGALVQKALGQERKAQAARFWAQAKRRPYLWWPVVAMTQKAAVVFNLGLLAAFAGSLMVLDLGFFWESTDAAAPDALTGVVRGMSAPWVWFSPHWAPTLQQVEDTRIEIQNAEKLYPLNGPSAEAWVPFLTASLVFWGAMPRLVLALWFSVLARRSRQNYGFNERRHRELWRRLVGQQHTLTAVPQGQEDDAAVVLWGGFAPPETGLRAAVLQQLRLNPAAVLTAGGMEVEQDREAVARIGELRTKKKNPRIVLVAESWSLIPKDLTPFLKSVRETAGQETPITLFLTGLSKSGDSFADVPEAERVLWEDFAADLNDSHLNIRPFRGNLITSAEG